MPKNPPGCKPYAQKFAGDAVFMHRRECTFLERLVHAGHAGQAGVSCVVVISNHDLHINPSRRQTWAVWGSVSGVVVVVLRRLADEAIAAM